MTCAVIYRMRLKPDKETLYQEKWKEVVTYFKKARGALGSCLHKAEDGTWIAYSRWPDQATRDAAWPSEARKIPDLPASVEEAIAVLKGCLDETQPGTELVMEIMEDQLINEEPVVF